MSDEVYYHSFLNRDRLVHILDTDPSTCEALSILFRLEGFQTMFSMDPASFFAAIERRRPDVVVLNRVVCCSPHGLELTAAAAGLTRRLLLLSFPRYRWWIRLGSRLQHVALRLVRRPFETFVRPTQSIVGAAESRGLRLAASGRDAVWEYVVLRR